MPVAKVEELKAFVEGCVGIRTALFLWVQAIYSEGGGVKLKVCFLRLRVEAWLRNGLKEAVVKTH